MDEIVHKLSSGSKLMLSALLENPMSPDEIAARLNITRQAVDKHIKEMISYGILDKIWVTSGRRPRVEYKLSSTGRYFYESLSKFIDIFRAQGLEDLENRLKSLDLQLISGEINQVRYYEIRDNIEKSMEWFIPGKESKGKI